MRRLLAFSVATLALLLAGFFWTRDRPVAEARLVAPPPLATLPSAVEPELPERAPRAEITPEQREARRFNRRDKDKDGSITRTEYLADRKKAFARQDANGDGVLDFEEFAVATARKFARADRDGDLRLDSAEFATTAVKRRVPVAVAPCVCDED